MSIKVERLGLPTAVCTRPWHNRGAACIYCGLVEEKRIQKPFVRLKMLSNTHAHERVSFTNQEAIWFGPVNRVYPQIARTV